MYMFITALTEIMKYYYKTIILNDLQKLNKEGQEEHSGGNTTKKDKSELNSWNCKPIDITTNGRL